MEECVRRFVQRIVGIPTRDQVELQRPLKAPSRHTLCTAAGRTETCTLRVVGTTTEGSNARGQSCVEMGEGGEGTGG